MWRRTYLLLLLLRVYLALSPSYLHPDEVFQGPEIIAGSLFSYPSHRTWEWTTDRPIRSVFPLWLSYGIPMGLLKSVWIQDDGQVEPAFIHYSLRMVMFILSFVLEDWAIYELVHSPKHRKTAVALVASSYVTWTFQTHSFSNSIETLLVLWSLVLIDRVVKSEHRSSAGACFMLGYVLVFGTFNRITFPAFVLIPGLRLLPYFLHRPWSFCVLMSSMLLWTFAAIATDTAYYVGPDATTSIRALIAYVWRAPVITPFNNILYNSQAANLAEHGIHPRWQHLLVNFPQLLGPAMIVLLAGIPACVGSKLKAALRNQRVTSAATGTLMLSLIPHQEARFLLPCVPLLLTCMSLPRSRWWRRIFWISWGVFNSIFGILMGIYHQGGIIPAQAAMPKLVINSLDDFQSKASNIQLFWWKTYPPPTYLLGANHLNPLTAQVLNITTVPLMGLNQTCLLTKLASSLPPCEPSLLARLSESLTFDSSSDTYLAAPLSSWRLEAHQPYPPASNFTLQMAIPTDHGTDTTHYIRLNHLQTFRKHLNLDDMDFGDDGVGPTLSRIIGRRGLGVWRVERICDQHVETI